MRLARHYCELMAMRHSLCIGFWSWCVSAAYVLFGVMVPPLRRLTFGKRPKSKQKVLPLACGSRCARLPSFHHCSRGTPRRAIPGPSRLSRHPCRSTPSTTILFTLLKGRLASSARFVGINQKQQHIVHHGNLMGIALLNPSYGQGF